jgi:GT2 family glycosyltransferase
VSAPLSSEQPTPGVGGQTVVALLVSHDGARWLSTVLTGLAEQIAPVRGAIAVDTGSRDDSAALLREALGADRVLEAPSATAYPAAVELGLAEIERLGWEPDWIWLVHDDSTPHPEALLALLAGAAEQPDADVLGPMLREWPSLRGILELGVTISGTGRRETGLEAGEYDQGQYDHMRRVLAVHTAGMLVRPTVLRALDGFDPELPIFGNDVDFGWRAAAAGYATYVVPQAVVFHAQAAHRGTRRTPLTGRHTHYQERRAALYTLLVNGGGPLAPRMLRLGLGTLLRMLGFALVRSPGEALDDLAAFVSVARHPARLRAARRARRAASTDPEAARRLLPPWWLPYRHGLDLVRDVLGAAGQQAADVAERRRAARAEIDQESFAARRVERLESLEDDELIDDTGLVARLFTNPVGLTMAVFVILALAGSRGMLGDLAGGGLSRAPEGVGAWWQLHLASGHAIGQGSDLPAPGYVLPMAILATMLGGSPGAAVSVLLVTAVPAAAWGAWRFLRVAGRLVRTSGVPRWVIAWGASTYALVPVAAGAWGQGRLGPVVAAVVLPWLGHAALGFSDPEPDRRWRAAWRTGLLLALITAFSPSAWLLAVLLGAVVVALASRLLPGSVRDLSTWAPPATALVVPAALLLPWWLPSLIGGSGGALLLDAGRLPGQAADGLDLLIGRFGDGGPWWSGVILPLLALVALLPRPSRIPVTLTWLVASSAAVLALVLAQVEVGLVSGTSPAGQGALLVVIQGAFVAAATLAAPVALEALAASSRPRRATAAGLVVMASLVPTVGLGWFLVAGGADLNEPRYADVPVYMAQSALNGPEHGILIVRGSVESGLEYTVVREDGIRLGEDEIAGHTPVDPPFDRLVGELVGRPGPEAVARLAGSGIEYVVMPEPADTDVAAELDATPGLVVASAENRSTRAWQVDAGLSAPGLAETGSWVRRGLLVCQAAALLAVLVLCAPTVRGSR